METAIHLEIVVATEIGMVQQNELVEMTDKFPTDTAVAGIKKIWIVVTEEEVEVVVVEEEFQEVEEGVEDHLVAIDLLVKIIEV